MRACAFLIAVACCIAGCNGRDTQSPVKAPGAKESAKTSILEAGAAVLQTQPPVGSINAYLDGFHFYNGHMKGQMEAHHYCAILNDEMIQCVIYDGNVKDAKMMGFTGDGQADPEMIMARDQRLGIDSEERKKNRADIAVSAIDPDADGWRHGKTVQINDPTGSQHDYEHAAMDKEQPRSPSQNSRSAK
jgi:hypothetical protein